MWCFYLLLKTYTWDVRDYFKGDATARDGAALRHPFQQTLSKALPNKQTHRHTHRLSHTLCSFQSNWSCWLASTHLSTGDVHTDTLPQHQLHVSRVAQLNHRADCQVDPLVRRRDTTQLRAVVDCWVPRSLHFNLDHNKDKKCNNYRFPQSALLICFVDYTFGMCTSGSQRFTIWRSKKSSSSSPLSNASKPPDNVAERLDWKSSAGGIKDGWIEWIEKSL